MFCDKLHKKEQKMFDITSKLVYNCNVEVMDGIVIKCVEYYRDAGASLFFRGNMACAC